MKERKMEGGRKEKRKEGKGGKERKCTCLCDIPRMLESGYHQSLDNVKCGGEWYSPVGSPLEYHIREERHKCVGRVQKSKITFRNLEMVLS